MINIIMWSVFWFAGASIFSFLNVVIYRLPRQISFVRGRSFCPKCQEKLKWYDLVPVFSWMVLRGKCRYCKEPVSKRYPVVEYMGGMALTMCLWRFGISAKCLIVFLFLCILTVLGFVDADTMEIPNGLSVAILLLGIADWLMGTGLPFAERFAGIFAVSFPMLLIALLIPGAFGGGDIKLMAAAGFLLGWKMNLLAVFLAIVLGGCYGMVLLTIKKIGRKDHFAFGPFLCVGMTMAMFVGEYILNWYLNFF